MRKTFFIIFLVLLSKNTFSQIETHYYGSTDSILSMLPLNENIPVYRIDNFDSQKERIEESSNPNIFAKGFDASISLDDGSWNIVDKGRIWSIIIHSTNATSLTLSFNELSIFKGCCMYIVNEEKAVLYGPITSENIPNEGRFLTDVIPGHSVSVCIFEPKSDFGGTSMSIDKVYCGFKEQSFLNEEQQDVSRGCDNEIACDNNYQDESFGIAHVVYS